MELDIINFCIAAGVSVIVAILSEAVNWYLIYRHDDYKKLVKDILENQLKLDQMKEK
jgi:hypothetical protein